MNYLSTDPSPYRKNNRPLFKRALIANCLSLILIPTFVARADTCATSQAYSCAYNESTNQLAYYCVQTNTGNVWCPADSTNNCKGTLANFSCAAGGVEADGTTCIPANTYSFSNSVDSYGTCLPTN